MTECWIIEWQDRETGQRSFDEPRKDRRVIHPKVLAVIFPDRRPVAQWHVKMKPAQSSTTVRYSRGEDAAIERALERVGT